MGIKVCLQPTHSTPNFAATLGRCEAISKGTLAMVRGFFLLFTVSLGRVLFARRKDLPIVD